MDAERTSHDPAQTEEAESAPTRRRLAVRFSFVAVGAAIVWLVTWLAIAGTIGRSFVSLNLVIASACVVLFGLVVLWQERTWVWPVRHFNQLLPRIRAGELPIDSLSEVEGGLKELTAHVQSLLHELRQQKTHVKEIEAELSQRIANRTDALERTIGSLRQQAVRDPLTGLYNRRMLDQYLPDAIEKCRAKKINLALLMIDVDYFKILNDTLGHASGDELLRNIGQIIRSTIREDDTAFRCGGDEFVVVLPACDEASAEAFAKRIESLVTALAKTLRIQQPPALSIGMATLGQVGAPSATALLEEADRRLYQNKSARKANCRPSTLAKAS
jgi:diguanylate cyclase (GGDEF)-like protein